MIHNGDLIVTEGNIEYASALTSVNGDLIVDAAGADFPFLFFVDRCEQLHFSERGQSGIGVPAACQYGS